ncbi:MULTISPECIES: helix-turn-helix transcriptional regulator [Paenibacillus]|uniref:YafY family transcriptional regulator n=1 Tax=Paenibacillus xylanilyticus TaxID=248903 RepID=A0A7Y6EV93_9BACL|nr:YafY family protein [Paenibacillus xylanilyticus]NUU76421.1 YafY family transcriptional regulator [Paenibacillus xylanilyticus]
MNKINRLAAIVMALQHGLETAHSLADKFEVSRRTILRDIQSLSEMNVPIIAISGPGGGFRLMEGYVLPPLQLDPVEAATLIFALEGISHYADTPFQEKRWTVMDKIKGIIPDDVMARIDPMLQQLNHCIPERNYILHHLEPLLTCIPEHGWLRILYRSAARQRWIQICPIRIYASAGFWYCEAYSEEHGEQRLFRVDRILEAETIDSSQTEQLKIEAERVLSQTSPSVQSSVRIKARLSYCAMVEAEQDRHIGEKLTEVAPDVWELSFLCPADQWEWAVRFFYRLGREAEVIEPEELRSEIRQHAEDVSQMYTNTTPKPCTTT